MRILTLLHASVISAYYAWALREVDPLNPSVPRIVLRKRELDDRLEVR